MNIVNSPILNDSVSGVFSRLTQPFVDELVEYIGTQRVLEIFAGNGFLSKILFDRGIDLISTTRLSGYDIDSNNEISRGYSLFANLIEMDAVTAVSTYQADILLMSWPTVTSQAIRAVQKFGKNKSVIFIGEVTDYSTNPPFLGGCATDEFFEQTEVIHEFQTYPKYGSHDHGRYGEFAQVRILK